MAIQAITNHLVSPTENDVNGGTTGAGIVFGVETTMADLLRFPDGMIGRVISGFTPPATGTGSRVHAIAAGVARIDGYTIKGTSTTSNTFTNGTEYWWLQLLYTSSKVVSVQLVSFTSETTYPANAIPLWKVVANATELTTVTDRRPGGRRLHGCVGSGGAIDEHGSGFWSVSKGGAGTYTLTFASGVFLRTPIVIVAPNATDASVSSAPTTATNCPVYTTDLANVATDKAWGFTATL